MGRKSTSGFPVWNYVKRTPGMCYCEIEDCGHHQQKPHATQWEAHIRQEHPEVYRSHLGRASVRRSSTENKENTANLNLNHRLRSPAAKKPKTAVQVSESPSSCVIEVLSSSVSAGHGTLESKPANSIAGNDPQLVSGQRDCSQGAQLRVSPLAKRPHGGHSDEPPSKQARGSFFVPSANIRTSRYFLHRVAEYGLSRGWDVADVLSDDQFHTVLRSLRPGVWRPTRAEALELIDEVKGELLVRTRSALKDLHFASLSLHVWSDNGGTMVVICGHQLLGKTVCFPWRGKYLDQGETVAKFFEETCLPEILEGSITITGIVAEDRRIAKNAQRQIANIIARSREDTPDSKKLTGHETGCIQIGCFCFGINALLVSLLRNDGYTDDGALFSRATYVYEQVSSNMKFLETLDIPPLSIRVKQLNFQDIPVNQPYLAIECFKHLKQHWTAVQRLLNDVKLDYISRLNASGEGELNELYRMLDGTLARARVDVAIEMLSPAAELIQSMSSTEPDSSGPMCLMEAVRSTGDVLEKLFIAAKEFGASKNTLREMKKRADYMLGSHRLCGYFVPSEWSSNADWQTKQIFDTTRLVKEDGEKLGLKASGFNEVVSYFRATGKHGVLPRTETNSAAYWDNFKGDSKLASYLHSTAVIGCSIVDGDRWLGRSKDKWDAGCRDDSAVCTAMVMWRQCDRMSACVRSGEQGAAVIREEFGEWTSSSKCLHRVGETGAGDVESQELEVEEVPTILDPSDDEEEGCEETVEEGSDSSIEKRRAWAKSLTHGFFQIFEEVECSHVVSGKSYSGYLMVNARKKSHGTEYHILYDADPSKKGSKQQLSHSMSIGTLKSSIRSGHLIIPVLETYVNEGHHRPESPGSE
ncbi:hypothetical protein FOZ60_008095 [Perkinsus olseni]|uniref:Uncharacterized protein n=1 Tax=Perkinsus olseni TaxID=32597 RepID=A0A7J6NK42_PEROL|nr:hypothetical protein FOZ60_008095 [Perkinsus olseni]